MHMTIEAISNFVKSATSEVSLKKVEQLSYVLELAFSDASADNDIRWFKSAYLKWIAILEEAALQADIQNIFDMTKTNFEETSPASLQKFIVSIVEQFYANPEQLNYYDWRQLYSFVFSESISKNLNGAYLQQYGRNFDYYDPDTSYEEDVCAYIHAIKDVDFESMNTQCSDALPEVAKAFIAQHNHKGTAVIIEGKYSMMIALLDDNDNVVAMDGDLSLWKDREFAEKMITVINGIVQ